MSITEMETLASSQEYVGFWARFGASIIDTILLMVIILPLMHMIYGSQYWDSEEFILGVPDFIVNWIFPLVATVVFWVYKSATPGKMALKAKVVDARTGNTPTVKQSIIRYIGYYISLLPIGLGFLWVGWDKKKQGWHDKLAGTVVIRPINKGIENVSFSSNKT